MSNDIEQLKIDLNATVDAWANTPTPPPSAMWVEGSVLGVTATNAKGPVLIFVDSMSAESLAAYPPNSWTTIDWSAYLPLDTKAIFLAGILIITHGNTQDLSNLMLHFRAPGDTADGGNYHGQASEVWIGGGKRQNYATWVPVIDGKFEFFWNATVLGTYPEWSAFGINLSLQAYLR
jgi:hypothetical protein